MTEASIAICGAGIASLCLAHKLSKLPNIKVDIYEARTEQGEDGAAIGLGINAQTALRLIAPELRAALEKAGATVMDPSARFFVGTGPEAGTHIGDISNTFAPQMVVQRGPFMRELRALLPQEMLHVGKKLDSLADAPGVSPGSPTRVKLTFEDGAEITADCVVGCDGINSVVRSYVLGSDHPALHPVYNGGFGVRAVVSLDEAITLLGADYCRDRTQKIHIGQHAGLLTDLNDNGTSMQLIAGFASEGDEPGPTQPYAPFPKDKFAAKCAAFGQLGDAMASVFCRQPTLYVGASRYHTEIPTFIKGTVCVAGDAAYAFSPARGAGAGQAIEDALILGAVFESTQSEHLQLGPALAAYDAIRRPRRTMVAQMSAQAGRLITAREPGVGLDVEKLRHHIRVWNREIYDYDLDAACQQAAELMVLGHSSA